jgi:hypothetical protein
LLSSAYNVRQQARVRGTAGAAVYGFLVSVSDSDTDTGLSMQLLREGTLQVG